MIVPASSSKDVRTLGNIVHQIVAAYLIIVPSDLVGHSPLMMQTIQGKLKMLHSQVHTEIKVVVSGTASLPNDLKR